MAKVMNLARDSNATATAIAVLRQQFGERITENETVREQHGHTLTWLANQPPEAVFYALSTKEISEAVKVCNDYAVPVIAFGTGTSLEGHINAPHGGVSIDVSRMDNVVAVHAEDLDCVVQPGVTRKQLNVHLRDQGLFFPIDPGADASLGGMASTRASGTNAVLYGTMRDNVIALKAVLPDGTIISTGSRAKKSSAGYDLTRLFIGAEGTLGIITELTLRLRGIPEAVSAAVCDFPTIEDACNAVIATIQYGIPVARIELLDELQIRACNAYSNLSYEEKPTLFLEFHGSKTSVSEQAETFGEIASGFGGGAYQWTTREEERLHLWQARHDAYWAVIKLRPGARAVATDVCVPISRLAECVRETKTDLEEAGLLAPIVGHVGDGNFHVTLLVDETDEDELAAARQAISRMNQRAISMDGTCTGEHGVGQGKIEYMEPELGSSVGVMQAIKSAIDPNNVMNPGKIIPD